MRTRLIRPEFWSDERMADLTISTRLVYIGLWGLADDAGYFECRVRLVGAALFPYDALRTREKVVESAIAELTAAGRVIPQDCADHAIIPTLPVWKIRSGEPLFTVQKAHRRKCVPPPPSVGLRSPTSNYPSVSVSDSVSDSDSSSAQAREDFTAAMLAAGVNPTLTRKVGRREEAS